MGNIQTAKVLIDRDDINEDKLILYFDMVERKVRAYCHIPSGEDLDPNLDFLIAEMVAQFYKLNNPVLESYGSGSASGGKEVTSIKRGDTTITYGGDSTGGDDKRSMKTVDEFVSDYRSQLWTYRRLARVK